MNISYALKTSMLIALVTLTGCSTFTSGNRLPTLTSNASRDYGFTTVKAAYLNTVNYFGYISKNAKPDAIERGKNAFYLYVWVPAAVDELGVRMISPVGSLAKPSNDDFLHPGYSKALQSDPDQWFDTWLRIERMSVINPKNIKQGGTVISLLDQDDDGDDTFNEK